MHARAMMMFEELAKAILFLVMAIFVFIFLAKLFSTASYIPEWSKSLSGLEKAIDALSEKDTSITRTATVLLKKGYHIKGYKKNDAMCPEEISQCICACSSPDCSNAAKDNEKFCKEIKYAPGPDFLIDSTEEKPLTYTLSLVKDGSEFIVKISGLSNA